MKNRTRSRCERIRGWSSDEIAPRHSSYCGQPTLFPMTLQQLEVATGVSADEMRRWYERGLLSFDPLATERIDWAEETEVRFVRDLARSGLSDEWVDEFLAALAKPYCYEPETMLYSFATGGWIMLPAKLDMDEELVGLAEEGEWKALRSIRDRIDELLGDESEEDSGASQ